MGMQRNVVEILDNSFANFNRTQDEVLGDIVNNTEHASTNFDMMTAAVKASGVALQTTGKLAQVFSGGVVGLTEKVETLAPILQDSGHALRAMDSDMANVVGTMSLVSGLALKNFSKILNLVIFQIGDLTQKIGLGLFLAMRGMELRFLSFEKTLAQFEFGVKNFSQSLGKDAVGDLKLWQKEMTSVVDNSRFSVTEVAKSIKLIVAEGSFLGLSVENMVKLNKRAVDLAVFTGRNLDDVMLSLLTSLTGNVQAAMALGIDMRELALQQTALFKVSGKTYDALTDQEKIQIRLQQVFKKTAPIMGAAAQDLTTFTGKTALLAKQMDVAAIKMGQMGKFTNALITAALTLATTFTNLPAFILEIVGNFIDLGGVVLTAAGTITKYVVAITTAMTAFKVFNIVIKEAIILQKSFTATTAATTALNMALAGSVKNFADLANVVRTVLVAGLAGVIAQFRLAAAAVAGFVATISTLGGLVTVVTKTLVAIGATVGKVFAFAFVQTKALLVLLGPFALKIGLIVGAVMLFKKAFEELHQETMVMQDLVAGTKHAFDELGKALGFVKTETKSVGQVFVEFAKTEVGYVIESLVDLAKLIASGLLGSLILLGQVTTKVRMAFADTAEESEQLQKTWNELAKRQENLAGSIIASTLDLLDYGTAIASAAEGTEHLNDELDKHHGLDVNPAIAQLATFLKTIDTASVRTEALGDKYTQLKVQIGKAGREQAKATENFLKGGEDSQKYLEEIKNSIIEGARLGAELDRMRIDGIKELAEKSRSLEIERLDASGKFVEAAKMESAQVIAAFDKEADRLKEVFKLRQDELAIIEKTRAALVEKTNADIGAAEKKASDELLKHSERIADLTERINDSRLGALKEILEEEGETLAIIQMENAARLALFDSQVAQLKTLKALRQDELDDLARARDLIIEANELKADKERGTTLGDVGNVIAQAFNPDVYVKAFEKGSEIVNSGLEKGSSILEAGWSGFASVASDAGGFLLDVGKEFGNYIVDKIASINLEDIGNAIMAGAEGAYDILSTIFSVDGVNFVADFIEGIKDFPKLMLEAFENLGSILDSFIDSFPQMVDSLVQQLPGLIEKIVAAIPKVVTTLIEALPKISKTLIDGFVKAMPVIAQALAKAIPVILVEAMKAIGPTISALVKELPTIVNAIMEGITQAIPYLVESLIQIIYQIAETLPTLIEGFLERLPDMIEALAKAIPMVALALVDAIIGLFIHGGIERIVGSILRAIPRIVVALVTGFVNGVVEGLKRMFGGGAKFKINTDALENAGEKISKGFKKVGDELKRSTSQLFKVIDGEADARGLDVADRIRNAIKSSTTQAAATIERTFKKSKSWGQRMWDAFSAFFEWFGDMGTKIWNGFLKPIFNWFGDRGTEIWNGFLKPILSWFGDRGTEIWEGFLKPIGLWFGEMGTAIWNGFLKPIGLWFGEMGTAIWDGFLKPIGQFFARAGKEIWNGFLVPIGEFFLRAGKNIWAGFIELANVFGDWGTAIWNGWIKPIGNFFAEMGGAIWSGFLKPIGNAFGDFGTLIWNGFLKPIGNAFVEFGSFIWTGFLKPIGNAFGDFGTMIWTGFIKPIGNAFGDMGTLIWDSLKAGVSGLGYYGTVLWNGFKDAISGLGDIGTGIWKGVVAAIDPKTWSGFGEKILESLTKWKLPTLPTFEFPKLPTFSWPTLPKFAFPDLPKFSWPKMPSIDLSIPKPDWLSKIGGAVGGFFSDPASSIVSGAKNVGAVISDAGKDVGGAASDGYKNVSSVLSGKKKLFNQGGYASAYGRINIPQGKVINGILHAQGGAFAQGTDTLDAKLTPGEFVVNREATRNNLGLLSFINEVRKPISPVQGNTNISIVINAKTDLSADQIRREVIPELEKQLRRKSQEGRFVIDSKGIRV
jgi:hypothetical protein